MMSRTGMYKHSGGVLPLAQAKDVRIESHVLHHNQSFTVPIHVRIFKSH